MKIYRLEIVITDNDGETSGPNPIWIVGEDEAYEFAEWFTEYAWVSGDRNVDTLIYKANADDMNEMNEGGDL